MRRIAALTLVFSLAGCAHLGAAFETLNSTLLTEDYLGTPVAPVDVDLFLADEDPPGGCERVALLRAAPTVDVVDALRSEAGRLGANAVHLRDFRGVANARAARADEGWNVTALRCPTD